METSIATALEVLIQAVEIERIEPQLGGRWHSFVFTPLREDVQELLSARGVAVGLERHDKTRGEGRSLAVFAVAAGALQTVLLPPLISHDLDGIPRRWVIGIGHGCRCRRRRGARGRGRGSRTRPGARGHGIEQRERRVPEMSGESGSAHGAPASLGSRGYDGREQHVTVLEALIPAHPLTRDEGERTREVRSRVHAGVELTPLAARIDGCR
jgi:hypothetical protein